ncbi:MAG: hypothetical protein GTN40_00915 [Candidatus Aenigmarchaeota archaeon]|nr:hypothetical protein [Candidatus Aenigmarchaeota archaeon]
MSEEGLEDKENSIIEDCNYCGLDDEDKFCDTCGIIPYETEGIEGFDFAFQQEKELAKIQKLIIEYLSIPENKKEYYHTHRVFWDPITKKKVKESEYRKRLREMNRYFNVMDFKNT